MTAVLETTIQHKKDGSATVKHRKPKKLSAKDAIKIGQLLIARIAKLKSNFEHTEKLFKTTLASLEAQQKALQEICPHPKKFFRSGGFEYLNEHCDLCGFDEWY